MLVLVKPKSSSVANTTACKISECSPTRKRKVPGGCLDVATFATQYPKVTFEQVGASIKKGIDTSELANQLASV